MTIDDKIEDENLQYDINREAAKLSVLSTGKTNKYEYLTGEEILPFNQKQRIEKAKFNYSPLGKAFKKQLRIEKAKFNYSPLGKAFKKQINIEDQGKKQVNALKDLNKDIYKDIQ